MPERKTVGQLMEEMRLKAGAQNYHGHEYMDLERFAEDTRHMLNQAGGDRQILAKQLGISPHQLSYVTHSSEGEGLLFYGSTILPFVDHFPKNTELYRIMTTKPQELKKEDE